MWGVSVCDVLGEGEREAQKKKERDTREKKQTEI
jgi:hypothetical protein